MPDGNAPNMLHYGDNLDILRLPTRKG